MLPGTYGGLARSESASRVLFNCVGGAIAALAVHVIVFAVQPERGSGACLPYTYQVCPPCGKRIDLRTESIRVRAPVSAD